MTIFFYILSVIIIFQLTLPFLTVLTARYFGKERVTVKDPVQQQPLRNYACIITAYKNATIAIPLIHSILKQSHASFHIYLVADSCPADFETGIVHPKLSVFIPEPALNLKAKSIIYAMDRLVEHHEYTVIFDADNLAHPDFLTVINRYADSGHRCIQAQRRAKNTDNKFAAADALGEMYKNYIERYTPYLLGSSAAISGSGMATEMALYRAYLDSPAIQEGQKQWKKMLQEDKILQNYLLMHGEKIAYARTAVCYDEKVQSANAVQTQRSRWLFSYFQNLPNTLQILTKGLLTLNKNMLLFGLVTLSLPLFIQLGMAFVLFLLGLWLNPVVSLEIALAVMVFTGTILWTLSRSGASGVARRALSAIPPFIGRQFFALLNMRNPNKHFKHTEHTQHISVEDVLNKKEP